MEFPAEVYVSYESAQELRKKMPQINTGDESILFENSAVYGSILAQCLNEPVLSALQTFKDDPLTTALVVRGLPIDTNLPPTPYARHSNLMEFSLATAINVALYHQIGISPVTYQGENGGRLFRDVVPKLEAVKDKSSYGSAQTLGMHVDNCHLPLEPETHRQNLSIAPGYLSLYGMRCDLRVSTKITFVEKVIDGLDMETREVLKQPLYELSMPDSFSNRQAYQLPVLVQDDKGSYYCRFDKEYTRPLTEAAVLAFKRFEEILYEKKLVHSLFLQPGDFLIFKNQRITHSREAFQARFDGTDRWLLRLFGVNCLSRTIPVESINPYHIKAV